MKKVLFLIAFLAFTIVSWADDSGTCGENLTWVYDNSSKTLTISGSGAMEDYAKHGPWNKLSITKVVIEDGVTTIGDSAFYNCRIKSIEIPTSLTTIGEYAFYATELDSITIPSSVTSIGDFAFDSCSKLESIVVEEGNPVYDSRNGCNAIIETATDSLFRGTIHTVIPDDIIHIGDKAFESLDLKFIDIPNRVTTIGDYAFKGNNIGNNKSKIKLITIPKSVSSIGEKAFANSKSLTDVYCFSADIPETKTNAFEEVDFSAATLHVPAGMVDAYKEAEPWKNFGNIISLRETNIEFADAVVEALCVARWDVNGDDSLSLDEAAAVTSLRNVFAENTEITSFDELQYFTGLATIGKGAFESCSKLASITIPKSVESIGDSAFYNCSKLEMVVSLIETPFKFGSDAFYGINGNCLLIVPVGKVDDYIKQGWTKKVFKDDVIDVDTTDPIPFEDDEVKRICVTNWDKDRNGVLSIREASNVTALKSFFKGKIKITSFDELEYFTGLTSLESNVFAGCTGLISITLPENLTKIGNSAFKGCTGLTTIKIPKKVTEIGGSAFYGCTGLKTVELPDTVTFEKILDAAFKNCTKLPGITLPDGVKEIGKEAFFGDTTLTEIKLPKSLTVISEALFRGCKNLKSVTIQDSVTTIISSKAFRDCSSLTDISLPKNLKEIGEGAFNGCTSMETITLPITLKEIGESAFKGCTSLNSVVSEISPNPFGFGANAFDDISKDCILWVPEGTKEAYLKAGWTRDVFKGGVVEIVDNSEPINFDDDKVRIICLDKWDINRDGVLTENEAANVEVLDTIFKGNTEINSLKVLRYFTGLTSIPDSAFSGCKSLEFIELSDKVINIGAGAFDETKWYDDKPDGVVYAGKVAYKYKGSVSADTSVELQEGTLGIADKAFEKCESLTSIVIPESVRSIGERAFSGCSGLESISVTNSNPVFNSQDGCNAIIRTADSTLIVGCKTTTIPSNVKSIGEIAFYGDTTLTYIEIPDYVKAIGDSAFAYCKNLKKVESKIKTPFKFGNGAFYGIDDCLLIVPEDEVKDKKVGEYVSMGWTKKVFKGGVIEEDNSKRIEIQDPNVETICVKNWDKDRDGKLSEREASQVTALGSVFRDSTAIKIKSFDELACFTKLTSLESNVFAGCTGLTSIKLPENLTKIGNSAFKGCTGLNTIKIPEKVTEIGASAFYGCTGLQTVELPESLNKIFDSAFRNCESLESITLPEKVTEIGESVFNGCKSLVKVTSNIKEPFEFGANAFANISKYCILTVPDGTKEKYIEKGWTEDESDEEGVFKKGVFKHIYEESEEQKPDDVTLGDVNDDTVIDITDAIMIVYYSLDVEQPNFNEKVADVNGDGFIDLTDAIAVVYMSLGVDVPNLSAKERRAANVSDERVPAIYVNDIVIPEGGTADVHVLYRIDSSQKGVGFQFNLETAEGLSTVKDTDGIPVYLKDDTALSSFSIIATEGDGFAAIPLTVTAGIQSGEGRLLTLTMKADPSLKAGDEATAVIKNPAFSMKEASGNVYTVTMPDLTFKVKVTTATGIEDGASWKVDEGAVYDLNGRKLNSVRKGVNIVDGNKVLVK